MFTVRSAVLVGLVSRPVTVTATLLPGHALTIQGIPDAATRETRVRVKSALAQLGIETDGVGVQVSPAVECRTDGLDLPIALAVAGLHGKVSWLGPDAIVLGELDLTGKVRPVRGILTRARARAAGRTPMIVPWGNARDAAATDAAVFACDTLAHAIDGTCEKIQPRALEITSEPCEIGEIPHAYTRRALEIAAAGAHPLLLVGPPGCGKTLAARRMPGILPRMTPAEALDVATIHDAAGLRTDGGTVARPFRAPHHTCSEAGLIGGGDAPRPGEVTIAHGGVLFLDELSEFRRPAIEGVARALRDREVVICRRDTRAVFPSAPLLVGAANGCGCGYFGASHRLCGCTPERLASWRTRAASYEAMFAMRVTIPEGGGEAGHESSATVRERVTAARKRLASGEIPTIHAEAQRMLDAALARRIGVRQSDAERVARTIAVLDGSAMIQPAHMAEAIALRVAS